MDTLSTVKDQLSNNRIIIYMKGSPEAPHCGFSARAVQCLSACDAEFAYVDILSNPDIRQTLIEHSNWPTYPQLYINGELVGGCDIIMDLYAKGELQKMVSEAVSS